MKGYDYNISLSAFYASYVAAEVRRTETAIGVPGRLLRLCAFTTRPQIPSNIMAKIVGPGKWLPFLTFSFGLLSLCTAWVNSFGSLVAVRFLLGAFEAGLLPGIAFYM